MSNSNEIFEWESITQPSYWGRQITDAQGQLAMGQIIATGANTVTIIPNFFQTDQFSSEVKLNLWKNNYPWDNESDTFAEVKQSILVAKERGLKVVLKPHVESDNRVWRAEFEPTDPKAWFDSYKAMMVEYAKVAQEAGAEMICVGTEMVSMTDPTKVTSDGKTYTEKWVEIIDAVRAVYSGKVTYAATYDEVVHVGFWDKVDYIGIDAYIPSSKINNPTVGQIVDAWVKPHFNPWIRDTLYEGKSVVDYYKSLSERYGKKVIFTEVGYKSMDGHNKDPGIFGGSGEVDFQEQVDCYEALFHVMENYGGQWLAGAFLWSYYSFENPMLPVSEGGREVPWTDYTTQHKPANATITEHYSSPAHKTGLVWSGTAGADKLDGGYHNDTLNGAGGNDALWGGAGDDVLDGGAGDQDRAIYSGARAEYSVTKNPDGSFTVLDKRANGNGRDIVFGVETFQFSDGTVSFASVADKAAGRVLIGTKKANKLNGEDGNDRLYGKSGKDVLTGGAGQDIFVFDTKPNKKKNLDKIKDFSVADDTIWLDNKIFKKLGKKGSEAKPAKLNKKFFSLEKAKGKDDYLVYSKKKGILYYDADGSGAGKAVEIAKLSKKLKLTANDFFVV
ncbi:glycoside hydrolase family 113 [Microvirga lenta]|uniref:glycoside hydrolase family 113 n=1 Tax=Microvirga lenta TaxID=2881337 RepID=UPI001CFFF10C|nr:hypothetical protein [Microvirga lenta]MCB5175294.1 hypothetical protein [Microvirga lenta]